MSLLRITNGFGDWSDSALIQRANFIHDEITSRPTVFTTPVPSMAVVKTAIDDFSTALNAASGGSRVQITHKNLLRDDLVDKLHKLGYYVLFTSGGDAYIAEQSGFRIAKQGSPTVVTPPSGLAVNNTTQSGNLMASVKRQSAAKSYMFQYTTDATLKEESWVTNTCTTSKCLITGLVPGTKYYIRVAVVGSNGQVLYSDVVNRIAA